MIESNKSPAVPLTPLVLIGHHCVIHVSAPYMLHSEMRGKLEHRGQKKCPQKYGRSLSLSPASRHKNIFDQGHMGSPGSGEDDNQSRECGDYFKV